MRTYACLISALLLSNAEASAVASDLAMLARSPNDHPVAKLPGIKDDDAKMKRTSQHKTLLHRHESNNNLKTAGSQSNEESPLNLWRVRIALGVVIIAMVAAIASLATHTARVFGWLPEEKTEAPLSPKSQSDPESLTRLLNMQSIRGYGAIFSSRSLLGSSSPGADKPTIIIQ
jgi:hypothetical protein